MSCSFPVSVYVKSLGKSLSVPCRRCMSCRVAKRSKLEALSNLEMYTRYRKGQSASFVTLTYKDACLPPTTLPDASSLRNIDLFNRRFRHGHVDIPFHNPHVWNFDNIERFKQTEISGVGTLKRKDIQDFLKRFRRRVEYHSTHSTPLTSVAKKVPADFKVVYAGEYGDRKKRPHYHLAVFGIGASTFSALARTCWDKGIIDVGALDNGGVRYVLSYIDQAVTRGQAAQIYYKAGMIAPFVQHSHGIGREYFVEHIQEVRENNGSFRVGRSLSIPAPREWLKPLGYTPQPSVQYLRQLHYDAYKAGYSDVAPGDTFDGHGKRIGAWLADRGNADRYRRVVAFNREYMLVLNARRHGASVDNCFVTDYRVRGRNETQVRELAVLAAQ